VIAEGAGGRVDFYGAGRAPIYAAIIDATDCAANATPRWLTKPSFASSAATSRSER
jgi:hypothetical protein